jgi:RHS repeat-associated protein
MPIVVAEHALSAGLSTPSQVSAQLTFDGTAGTTYYYNSSSLRPGDIMQIGLQANATGLDTGSYPYTMTVADDRSGTWTTTTYSGTATVENTAKDPTFSALGAGWTIDGLNKIIPGTGGVLLDEGGGSVLWFSGSFGSGGGTYTSPAGDFSTLILNSNGTYTRTLTDGTEQNFSSAGLETSSVTPNGLTTTFSYSGNLLSTITDPFSEVTTFTYSGGELQSIKDPAGRLTTFTMSSGDLTAVEYPDTSTWDYGYGSSGLMTSVTEPSSTGEPTKIATITYDSAERVGTVTQANGTTEEFSAAQVQGWTNSGTSGSPAPAVLLAQVGSTFTDPMGNVTTSRTDWYGLGQTSQTTDALGNVTSYDLNANGLATVTIDPMNRITQDAYDSKGNVLKITNPDGSTITYGTYNSFAEPSLMTDELGRITTYTYDSHGNRTVVEDPMDFVTTYVYSSTQPGMLTSQTAPAPAGQSSYTLYTYQYDSDDRQTTITNADGAVTVNVYNSAGQVTKVTNPNNIVTTYSYDQMSRETGETDAAGTSLAGVNTYTYDAAGNQVTATDPDDETTTTTYNAMDLESTVTDPDTGTTSYDYNSDGQLSVLIDPVGNRTTFMYDPLGRQTTQVSPSVNSSSGVTSTTEYDADGEVIKTTNADGQTITYSCDSRGDQTGESWLNSSGSAIYIATYTYDAAQEMTGAADPNSLLTIAYDKDGSVGTIATSYPGTSMPTVTLTYGYDPDGDVTSIEDSLSGTGATGQGLTTYVYDPALLLTTITQSFGGTAGPQVIDSYNPGGQITGSVRSIGAGTATVNTTYVYNLSGALDDINNYIHFGHAVTTSSSEAELIDSDDQVLNQSYENSSGTGEANTYTYDPSGQLETSSDGDSATYSYDLNGNPNSTGYTTGAGNELTNSPGVTYTYDNDGNMISAKTSSGTTTYTYDYENRLTSVDQNGTVIATYTYDALGRRIEIDDDGTQTWTVFNGTSADANPYADFTSSGAVSVRYLFGPAVDAILARTSSSGATAWYMTDELGSVTDLISSSGTELDHIVYGPYGNIVSESDASDGDRFKFAGMQYDATTGLYYDHARYYDAAIGRFTSQDPKGFKAGDTNLYRYVANDPTNSTDPTGLQNEIL